MEEGHENLSAERENEKAQIWHEMKQDSAFLAQAGIAQKLIQQINQRNSEGNVVPPRGALNTDFLFFHIVRQETEKEEPDLEPGKAISVDMYEYPNSQTTEPYSHSWMLHEAEKRLGRVPLSEEECLLIKETAESRPAYVGRSQWDKLNGLELEVLAEKTFPGKSNPSNLT